MRTSTIIKKIREDAQYQEFFKSAMSKFGINSPTDFKDAEKKKNFFDYVEKNYSAKSEGRLREVAGEDALLNFRNFVSKYYTHDTKLVEIFNAVLKAVQMNSQVQSWKQMQPVK